MENKYNFYNHDNNDGYYQGQYQDGVYRATSNVENRKKKNKKVPKALTIIGCAILFGIISGVTFLGVSVIGNHILKADFGAEQTVTASVSETKDNVDLKTSRSVITSDVTSVVDEVMPSVVSITNLSVQEVQNFFGQTVQYESTGAGSGIIIAETDEELLIVTNYHVIEGSKTLTVTFNDESSIEAYVKGTDADIDIAVISVPLENIPKETKNAISVATLGDSTTLKAGEPAIAIGNALGYGQSVTTGVVSAVNRELTTTNETTGETVSTGVKLIQTDAAINPGNSGGALLNANGEVIGINSSKLASTEVEGMGYAIPISDIKDVLEELMTQKTKVKVSDEQKGYIGISGFDVSSESAQLYGMPVGVYVESVLKGGAAEKAGITKGNIITEFNGKSIKNMEELQEELSYCAVGETVTVTVQIPENNGEYTEKTIELVLGKSK